MISDTVELYLVQILDKSGVQIFSSTAETVLVGVSAFQLSTAVKD